MAGYFIFFRSWCGFPDEFSTDRLNSLSDEELDPALQSYSLELAQDPEIRARIKKRQEEFVARLKEASTKLVAPSGSRSTAGSSQTRAFPRLEKPTASTPWREILEYLEHPRNNVIPAWSPGKRIWFWESPSQAFTEQLIAELGQRRNLDYDEHQAEIELNPRYGLIPIEGLSDGQQASIRRCIKAIQEGRRPAAQNGQMALSLGQRAIQVAQELDEVWCESEAVRDSPRVVVPNDQGVEDSATGGDLPTGDDGDTEEMERKEKPESSDRDSESDGQKFNLEEELKTMSSLDRLCAEALQSHGKLVDATSLQTLTSLSATAKFNLVCWTWSKSKKLTPLPLRKQLVQVIDQGDYHLPDDKSGTNRVRVGIQRGEAILEKF